MFFPFGMFMSFPPTYQNITEKCVVCEQQIGYHATRALIMLVAFYVSIPDSGLKLHHQNNELYNHY